MIKICIPILKKIKAIDTPNVRSSHSMPTPKGAGVAIIISLIATNDGMRNSLFPLVSQVI